MELLQLVSDSFVSIGAGNKIRSWEQNQSLFLVRIMLFQHHLHCVVLYSQNVFRSATSQRMTVCFSVQIICSNISFELSFLFFFCKINHLKGCHSDSAGKIKAQLFNIKFFFFLFFFYISDLFFPYVGHFFSPELLSACDIPIIPLLNI